MFSGTTFTKFSGNVVGGHQKIDRSAYRRLARTIDMAIFPNIRQILSFEGQNGPDGIKAKSPSQDEPWHYFNPLDKNDTGLIAIIDTHYHALVVALRDGNREKAAFEASWLAHAIVDGLTPSHHYPYGQELERLIGDSLDTRDTILKKLLIPGDTLGSAIKKNWEMWGSKGLLSTHGLFDWGASLLIAPLQLGRRALRKATIKQAIELGARRLFLTTATEIAKQDIYSAYYKTGWNKKMMKTVKGFLAPAMVETVALIWYLAIDEAKNGEKHF